MLYVIRSVIYPRAYGEYTDNTLRATLTHRDLYLGRPCPISDYYDVCTRNGENRLISRREKYFKPHAYNK